MRQSIQYLCCVTTRPEKPVTSISVPKTGSPKSEWDRAEQINADLYRDLEKAVPDQLDVLHDNGRGPTLADRWVRQRNLALAEVGLTAPLADYKPRDALR